MIGYLRFADQVIDRPGPAVDLVIPRGREGRVLSRADDLQGGGAMSAAAVVRSAMKVLMK